MSEHEVKQESNNFIVKSHNKMVEFIENIIYNGRWAVAPMYVGLFITLVVYTYKFTKELFDLLINIRSIEETQLLIKVLELIDIVMIGNLVLIITIGSYTIFIRKLNIIVDKPAWLEHITSGSLKIKMGMSLIGVSSIHLLKDFIGVNTIAWEIVLKHVLIHLVFIISTVALAYTDNLCHPPTSSDHHN